MNEKILKRKVEQEDFYLVYLKTLNGHLGLTNRELDVLVQLCKTQASFSDEGYSDEQLSKIVFSSGSRQLIREHLQISPFNLNNIIKVLRAKKILLTVGKRYYINPRIFVSNKDKEYSINFKIEVTT